MTISALFATTSLVLVRAGWMRVVSASCLVSATCLLFSLSLSLFWVWFASDAGSLSDLSLLVYIKCIEIVQYLAPLCVSPRRIPICPPFEKCCPVQPAIGKKKTPRLCVAYLVLLASAKSPLSMFFSAALLSAKRRDTRSRGRAQQDSRSAGNAHSMSARRRRAI